MPLLACQGPGRIHVERPVVLKQQIHLVFLITLPAFFVYTILTKLFKSRFTLRVASSDGFDISGSKHIVGAFRDHAAA